MSGAPTVLVLGAGKMVEAILDGLEYSQDLSEFHLYSPSGKSAERLAEKFRARALKNLDEVKPDWILVGCKPQQLRDLKKLIGTRFKDVPFVSLLAALPEKVQQDVLGVEKLVRLMPNLPVRHKSGICLLSSNSAPELLGLFRTYFHVLGEALSVSEAELEELTLLCGSGPAFFYEFTRELARSFSSLTEEDRERLARKVLLGSGLSADREHSELTELINAVTSKGGVTIAVLEKWRENQFGDVLKEGIQRGRERSQELKDQILHS